MKRLASTLALTAGLSLFLLPLEQGTWAEPMMDRLCQTVPTRTPTLPPQTPGPETPTQEPAVDTPAPSPPTGTAQPSLTSTIGPTMELSQTPTPGETVSATGVSTRPVGEDTRDSGEAQDAAVPPASPEPPTSTPVAEATSWPTVGPFGAVGEWPTVFCGGAALVVLGVVILVALLALKSRAWRLVLMGLALLVGLPAVTLLLHALDLGGLPKTSVGSPTVALPPGWEPLVPTATPRDETVLEEDASAGGARTTHAATHFIAAITKPTEPGPRATTPRSQSVVAWRDRFGFGVALAPIHRYDVGQLHGGWYVTWSAELDPAPPQGLEFVQMVRVRGGQASPSEADLELIARANPGSLWLVGNEPDVLGQDNSTAEEYARVYHQVYTALKGADPTSQVAIGAVSQATPLRLQYLDMVLDAYRELYDRMIPVDVWNVHGFILREERGSWGVGIPPGISVDKGRLFEMEDHDDMEIFREQVVAFRRWMEDKGENSKPLIVSEYGILMPADYGFSHGRVRDFLYATFDFFLTATDTDLGYPADGDRLVQRWAWYSLSDTVYPTGNLFDPVTGQITPLGLAYGSYTLSP